MPCDRRLLRYSVRSFRPTRSPDERSLRLVLATTAQRCYMSVIAVVITLDRPETASCCLSSILHGSQRPDRVVVVDLSLIHISEPTRLGMISYAVFCLKKKK